MKTINLVVFNEQYWDKGLIYSQNLLPLIKLSQNYDVKVRLISFTSIAKLIFNRKEINKTIENLKSEGVDVVNYPVLFYPTKIMLVRWVLLPFFYLNVAPYISRLSQRDKKTNNNLYNLRSYQIAMGFDKFYRNHDNLYFDLRTDWIEENINCGNFKKNSKTVKMWKNFEKKIIKSFKKSFFISIPFRNDVLKRCNIELEKNKHIITYNPIDYSRFNPENSLQEENFLYTGSLGHWNNLDTYLDFFLKVSKAFPNSKFLVCTNTPYQKIAECLNNARYTTIKDRIEMFYNVSYEDLPKIYSRCKYGLQLMTKKDSRVGVKYIEYLAAGILPIVHENVLGAAMLTNEYGLGVVVSNEDLSKSENLIQKIKDAKPIDTRSESYMEFKHITDTNLINKEYAKIYELD